VRRQNDALSRRCVELDVQKASAQAAVGPLSISVDVLTQEQEAFRDTVRHLHDQLRVQVRWVSVVRPGLGSLRCLYVTQAASAQRRVSELEHKLQESEVPHARFGRHRHTLWCCV
jgi:hypothetical protein